MNKAKAVMAAMSLCVAPVYAGQEQPADPPELEFLEFLGEWSEADQQWLEMQQQAADEGGAEQDSDETAAQIEVNDHE